MKITLNLLPDEYKKVLRKRYVFRTILGQELYVVIFFALCILAFFGISRVLDEEIGAVERVNAQLTNKEEYKEVQEIHDLFVVTNETVQVLQQINKKHLVWENVLNLFSENIPKDLKVISLSTTDNVITVSGVATSREVLVTFKEDLAKLQIEDDICFENIDIPLDNLVKPENFNFSLSFEVNVNCMQ